MDIENKYYLIDLPEILKKKRNVDKARKLEDLNIQIASNSRSMDDSGFENFLKLFSKGIDEKVDNAFDRNSFEELRRVTQQMG